MAPNWIITVKALTKGVLCIPIAPSVMIMWPVDETGKNSVKPSTIAITSACHQVISNIYKVCDYSFVIVFSSLLGR